MDFRRFRRGADGLAVRAVEKADGKTVHPTIRLRRKLLEYSKLWRLLL